MVDVVVAITEPADAVAVTGTLRLSATIAVGEAPDRAAIALAPGWPKALPRPTLQGYGLRPAAAVQRKAVETGAPRVYRQTRQPLAEVSVAWQMNGWQQMLFDGFQRSVLAEGERWFGVTLGFPSGLALAAARFKDKLAMKSLGGRRWQVSGTLELRQRPVMSDAALTALLDDAGDPPAWPTALLPRPLADSWELEPKPALVRSDNLPGLPQQRQRSRNSTTEVAAGWELSAEQAALFDGFFRHRGRDGAQWFRFPLYQGIGTVQTDVRFQGEVDWTPRAGGKWGVSAPIEVREREVLSAAELATLEGEDGEALFATIAELHRVVDDLTGA
jgi:hypothetical protein